MILPIRTSIRPWRTPYANYSLIVINVLIFILTYGPHSTMVPGYGIINEPLREWARQFMLHPSDPTLLQFVSYAFLHGGLLHIGGNMFFLYLFGNNVNDRLGHLNYILLYLAGAVFSALGHIAIGSLYGSESLSAPLLGASGAVAAVIGAYLVLFPQTVITVAYWFIFIGTIDVPALYFIAFKLIVIDNILTRYASNIGYDAHLAGYAFGASAMLLMLGTGLLSSSGYDLWTMLRQWNRRRQYRDVVSGGHNPFSGRTASKRVKAKEVKETPEEKAHTEKLKKLRMEIADRIAQRNLSAAVQSYLELIDTDARQVIPRQYLLDISNQLASESKYEEAAQAYEQFLEHYRNYEYSEQVELMLGIIYSRYLHKQESAIRYLARAVEKLSDPMQIKMCKDELSKLRG